MPKPLYILSFLLLLGCTDNEDQITEAPFKSQFILQTPDEKIHLIEGDLFPFASIYISKNIITEHPDSSRFNTISGLGDRAITPNQIIKNTLYVNFTRRFKNGFNLTETQFRDWIAKGDFTYTSDANVQDGVGITWFDEKGVAWVSGKNIGGERILGRDIISETNPSKMISNQNRKLTIESSSKYTEDSWYGYSQKVMLKFNCMLYNEKNDSLEIKNSSFETLIHFSNE
jgi:hypothetical protein